MVKDYRFKTILDIRLLLSTTKDNTIATEYTQDA